MPQCPHSFLTLIFRKVVYLDHSIRLRCDGKLNDDLQQIYQRVMPVKDVGNHSTSGAELALFDLCIQCGHILSLSHLHCTMITWSALL